MGVFRYDQYDVQGEHWMAVEKLVQVVPSEGAAIDSLDGGPLPVLSQPRASPRQPHPPRICLRPIDGLWHFPARQLRGTLVMSCGQYTR